MASKAALIVVDFQNDFTPPHGALAVPDGTDITDSINTLLTYPFALKVATRDFHPKTHISFAANHRNCQPFSSSIKVSNPNDETQSYEATLWPVHCVQGTWGVELVDDLDKDSLDTVVDKGKDERIEMYSAFHDPFRIEVSPLESLLKDKGVTAVYVVGLAADFCVKATAEHALEAGFETYVVEEGTKPVMPEKWADMRQSLIDKGVKMVSMHNEEVRRVMQ
ncbi:pyrazinamidase/nicotinamidase [Emericellopsis cladophorae]|uniref:nicotinamidase n=1 Tax=Emericellopsis cladophorae TaxID=2686198 RepID=A0A9Q0BGL1_9HYPO|nr:pyrazinamidase/nicotinamidase [Emericellopsis cladophorae]KAI6784612.1 pyrazinamidase/nicotinamidase [Emericellopsis cladophorae]